ncbi:MAG: phosphatase PAP2 family protein [Candidatus Fournierella pullistercoris]|uniref:Phosphatase PAP2 family protein n=1 Tax=Candidatus Allofournierella pullistercoris TaxID=2838597 RepID=A0A948T2Z4_9FIRM|nr:phosphatase PAP2 family protein [Candidatus Fournierella pullistercoris]
MKRTAKQWLSAHPELWLSIGYGLFYLVAFFSLEQLSLDYHIIHCPLDDFIPFNEWFIIPYCIWYAWIPAVLVYLLCKDTADYLRLCFIMFGGMTLCLAFYLIWPSAVELRQALPRDNILCQVVALLRKADTSTNVLPSIHVSSTVAIAVVLMKHRALQHKTVLKAAILVYSVLVCLSTVFLQQHSVLDGIAGAGLSFALSFPAYHPVFLRLPLIRHWNLKATQAKMYPSQAILSQFLTESV